LLHELGGSSKNHSSKVLRLSVGEQRTKRSYSSLVAGSSDTVHDDMSLETCFFIVNTIPTKRRDHLGCIFMAILGQQPTWRFWKPDHTKEQDCAKHTLEGDWEAPRKCI
jgi:hypothetical protein